MPRPEARPTCSLGRTELLNGPFPCTNKFPSLKDAPERCAIYSMPRTISWKYYVPGHTVSGYAGKIWNAYDIIWPVRYGPEWNIQHFPPETNVCRDIRDGALPGGVVGDTRQRRLRSSGETGSAQSTRARRGSRRWSTPSGRASYWSSTAIVVVWDDWGGWYDHVPPPQLDDAGLGIRVPMIVVSPYAKTGYISHTQYEFGSIVRFVEDVWSLGRLGTTDVRANTIDDVFDFNQAPRNFQPIPAPYSEKFFEGQQPSNLPVDSN